MINDITSSEDYIKETIKKVTRHVIMHDTFDSIAIYKEYSTRLGYNIECHCGKSWFISDFNFRASDLDAEYVVKLIESMNTPDFFSKIADIKETGEAEKYRVESLIDKTGSPTISNLEI